MTAVMDVCRTEANFVGEMLVGDVGAVGLGAVQVAATKDRRTYISRSARLVECGEGTVIVERREDGYYIDLAYVPEGYRFERGVEPPISRVRGILNGGCT